MTRIVGEADIARNTLQVKVAIRNPDPRMHPEMLCRVEFSGSTPSTASGPVPQPGASWIPESAVHEREGTSAVAWVVDPVSETASPRKIQLSGAEEDGLVLVREGLQAGAKVIIGDVSGLQPGSRVRLLGDSQ